MKIRRAAVSSAWALLSISRKVTARPRELRRDLVYSDSTAYIEGSLGIAPNQTFRTISGNPPSWNVLTRPSTAAELAQGYVFLGINSAAGTSSGLVILDNNGSLVYWGPEYSETMHFRPQTYRGQPVLTFYDGAFFSNGYGKFVRLFGRTRCGISRLARVLIPRTAGNGTNYIMDQTYTVMYNVTW